jgi:DNA primase
MHVRVLELEAGLDPDEFIRKYGADTYIGRLDKSAGYFIWLADHARKKYGSASAEARMSGYEEMLLPAIRRISDRLERAAVATEVADYLGLDRSLVLAEFRKMPGQRTQPAGVSQAAAGLPWQERVLLRSIVVSREARDLLVPLLQASPAARQYRIWRLLETICAVYQEEPAFSFQALEARAGDSHSLLASALIADKSDEVFTPEQAVAFASVLAGEDLALQYKELQRRVHEAEKSGNMEEAMELMSEAAELKKRLRRNTAG